MLPLNEECGLIEWVNNTVGFRHSLLKIYQANNMGIPVSWKRRFRRGKI